MLWFAGLAVLLSGCGRQQPAAKTEAHASPAVVKNAPKEADLATITLTAQAEQRLGIETVALAQQRISHTRTFSADIVLPPDRRVVVTAPIGGTIMDGQNAPAAGSWVRKGQALYRLLPYVSPERDLRLQLERDVASAETRVQAAQVRADRAGQLLRDRAGSEKAVQLAREELDLAKNDLKAARSRLDLFVSAPLSADTAVAIPAPCDGMIQNVLARPGQAVPSGAPLFEVADPSVVWVRVPVYVGELDGIDTARPASIRGLMDSRGARGRTAAPIAAPPSADARAASADLYYELPNRGDDGTPMRPGQRVNAVLSLRGAEEGLVVRWSAILHDSIGGTWVYENIGPQVYTRRRVEVLQVMDSQAVLKRGPAAGAKIVVAGAMELYGTEFGAGK
jgi:RND family efflux transporter MFP subunit